MNDTPRVTVPVDELAQEIRRVDGNHDRGAGALAEALMPFLSSRLSAAPAPEGGAVKGPGDYTMSLTEPQAFERFPALASHIERMAVGRSVGSLIEWDAFLRELNAALATREVPVINIKCEADVGTAIGTTRLNVIRVEREDDGSLTAVTDHWPPAREDAQPVAWKLRCMERRQVGVTLDRREADQKAAAGWEIEPLGPITHPAPDALRVAVEALERIATVDMGGGFLGAQACRQVATKALSDMRANQKGGA